MTTKYEKITLNAAREQIVEQLYCVGFQSEALNDAIQNSSADKIVYRTNQLHTWIVNASRSLQTIFLQSRSGWEKARAESLMAKLLDAKTTQIDYEIDFLPHIPSVWL